MLKLADIPKHLLRSDLQRRLPTGQRFRNLTGQKFARATAIGLAGFIDDQAAWLCRCKCGAVFIVRGALLTHTESGCGCARKSQGGESATTEHVAWKRIWKHHPKSVSKRWKQYDRFLADVGRKPQKGYSLQRIDSNRPYGPGNVEWLSPADKNRNVRNILIRHNGKSLSITGWAKLIGISPQAMQSRITRCKDRGRDIRLALITPAGKWMPR